MFTTALLLGILSGFPQEQSATRGRTVVVKTGDTVVVPSGADARIVFSRRAEIRISSLPDSREILILVDEESRDGAPDGYVDRVHRYTLADGFPQPQLYRGNAVIEEVQELSDGAARRPRSLTFVTPSARLRVGSPNDTTGSEDVVIVTTAGQTRELVAGMYQGGRSFDEVEHVWLNHQEDSLSRVRTSLRLEAGAGGGVHIQTPGQRPDEATVEAARELPPSGRVVSWRPDPTRSSTHVTATPPQLLRSVPASYSADAMRRGVQGTVRLQLTVLEDGTVSEVSVIGALDPDLDRAAIEAARRWRFRPALENGRAIPAVVVAEFPFTIRGR